ncbi:RDD family protein [Arthrobacter sp. TMN-49]
MLSPGAPFCTLCGAAVNNRAASPGPATVPVGVPGVGQTFAPANGAVPGIVPVGTTVDGPLLAPRELGVDPRIGAATVLVPGGAGRRLAAALIDGVLPGILMAVAVGIGVGKMTVTQVGEFSQLNLSWLLILTGIASVLSLGYAIWLWLWEARSGKTPGNLMVGLRTTSMDGEAAGLLAIFLRKLMIAVSSIVPTVGPLLVIISNTWDANGKRQGWHDKVANTLVFNVNAGRNPIETGGIAERANFVPAVVPTISPVSSPLERRAVPTPQQAPFTPQLHDSGVQPGNPFAPPQSAPAQSVPPQSVPAQSVPPQSGPTQSAPTPPIPVDEGPITFVPGAARRAQPQQAQQGAPLAGAIDQDAGETRVRPVASTAGLRLTFDNGHIEDVSAVALIGRNPAGYDGEMISRLIPVQDSSRSVSKTHLHVRVGGEGLWVTDRNSTNGSAVTTMSGVKTPLHGGTPALADIGARVHFGDRSFVVGRQ